MFWYLSKKSILENQIALLGEDRSGLNGHTYTSEHYLLKGKILYTQSARERLIPRQIGTKNKITETEKSDFEEWYKELKLKTLKFFVRSAVILAIIAYGINWVQDNQSDIKKLPKKVEKELNKFVENFLKKQKNNNIYKLLKSTK